jgi:hypothetical protein
MEEKLQEIINDSKEDVERAETKVTNLRNKIDFCQRHKFKEEERIARLELDAIEMIVYRQSQTLKEFQGVLNAWNS